MVYLSFIDAFVDVINICETPYELIELIGSGSFGIVVKARDLLTSDIYAIKIICIPSSFDSQQQQKYITRISQEISALNQLKYHDNVIKLRHSSYGTLKKDLLSFFLVMEFCETDFRKYLNKKLLKIQKKHNEPVLKEKEIRYWIVQLVDALYSCYKFKYIHRDLKFANLLLKKIKDDENESTINNNNHIRGNCGSVLSQDSLENSSIGEVMSSLYLSALPVEVKFGKKGIKTNSVNINGNVKGHLDDEYKCYKLKLCDFGMAKKLNVCDELTSTVCGTPLLMPPEMVNRQSYNYKSDFWAIGVMILEMITGEKSIFKNINLMEYQKNRVKTLQKQISSFNLEKVLRGHILSPEIKDLLSRLLDKSSISRISFDDLKKHPFIVDENSYQSSLFVTKDVLSKINENENCTIVIDKEGEIDCRLPSKNGIYVTSTFILKKGIYILNIFNLKKSKLKCFTVQYEDTINKNNKKFNRTHFVEDCNHKYVERSPMLINFAIRTEKGCLKLIFTPSWYSTWFNKVLKYRIVIQKKDLSKI